MIRPRTIVYAQFVLNLLKSQVFSIVITLVDVHLNWLNWFHFLILRGLLVILKDCIISLSPFLDVTRMSMSTVSFLVQLNSGILCQCFSVTCDLSDFNSRINRYILTVGFFRQIFVCFNLFVLLFVVTLCLLVTVQPCKEWIPIKKNKKKSVKESNQSSEISIDTDTESMRKQCCEYWNREKIDFLITEFDNSESVIEVPCSKWSKLICLVSHEIINPKIDAKGKSIANMLKDPVVLVKLVFLEYLKPGEISVLLHFRREFLV